MVPARDPKYNACRQNRHDAVDVSLDGQTVNATCAVCGALLTIAFPDWSACHDESSWCGKCDEGAPHCECEGGPFIKNVDT